jgi:hypothetical protein
MSREKKKPDEPTPQALRRQAAAHLPRAGWTRSEWCARYGYSESYFYQLRKEGRAPDETLGRITAESDAKWKRRHTARSKPAAA